MLNIVRHREIMAASMTLALVLALAGKAQAAAPQIAACPTILNSLYRDYEATRNLFARWGPNYEANPIIRQLGPDIYFGIWLIGIGAVCKESRWWRVASVVVWAVQTYFLNTHIPYGTTTGMPLLWLEIKW